MPSSTEPRIFTGTAEPEGQPFDAWSHQPLLLSMEQGGIDWPSSCRNGSCRTCMGRLLHGSVRYDIEWPGLFAEEKEEGLVLPCVAIPCGDLSLQRENG